MKTVRILWLFTAVESYLAYIHSPYGLGSAYNHFFLKALTMEIFFEKTDNTLY